MSKASPPRPRYPHLFLPDGWDTAWVAAKASGAANVLGLGDSIWLGKVGSSVTTLSPLARVKTGLVAQTGLALRAEFFTQDNPNAGTDWPFGAITGGSTRANNYGYGSAMFLNSTAASNYQRFTAPYACTDLDILYLDNWPGTWTYSVDGGANVTVTNTSPAAGAANATMKRIQISGLSSAAHTIDIGNQSAQYCSGFFGVTVYPNGRGSSGLKFARMCFDGLRSDNYNASANGPGDQAKLLQGTSPQQDASTNTGFDFPTQPHLTLLELGINDCANNVTTAVLQTSYRRLIQALRRGQPNASILIVAPCNPDGVNSDQNTALFNPQNWHSYLIALRDIAQAYNCAFLNMHTRWGETPGAAGFLAGNDIHPLDAGNLDLANAILQVL